MPTVHKTSCKQATFLLSTLTTAILSSQYAFADASAVAKAPTAGLNIDNIAYADFSGSDGSHQTVSSNKVSVSITALYVINLAPVPMQKVEAGSRVIWSTTLTNNSNAPVQVSFEELKQANLSNIKVYVDSNQNGEFDSNDQLINQSLPLAVGQQVGLWIIATTNTALTNNQPIGFPLVAHIAEDNTVKAATDLVLQLVAPKLELTQTVDRSSIDPTNTKNFDIRYTLQMTNAGTSAINPTPVTIDGQMRSMVLLVNPIPANTTYKFLTLNNPNAVMLYRTGPNSYTTQPPADLSTLSEIIVAYPVLASQQTERLSLTVTMNSNAAQIIIDNQFGVLYNNAAGQSQQLQSNTVNIPVTGKPSIAITSGDFKTVIQSSPLGIPLSLKANATMCNADRNALDKVKLRIHSPKTGDFVDVIAVETAPNSGIYEYRLPTEANSTANGNDQTLQTLRRDLVDVSLVDCLDQNNQSTQTFTDVTEQVMIDPYGTVFDAKTGKPVAGATVILLDANGQPIGDNVAFKVDIQTGNKIAIPARQVTDAQGSFVYPQVIAGTYSFKVDTSTIPGNVKYTFSSDKNIYPVAKFSADKLVNDRFSYGGSFSLNAGDAALNLDIPIDPQVVGSNQLFVSKVASNATAEVGDFEDYTVTIANRGSSDANDVLMTDTLPRGFIYTAGTMRVNGVRVDDPIGLKSPYLKLGVGSLKPNNEVKIQYRVQVGPNALNGDGINRARAQDATGQVSNEAAAKVEVRPGALISDGFIIGKVFADCNRNGVQDPGEQGIAGVRLYLEDGSFVVTDREGKYDFYGIQAKTHVLKLDRTTIPANSELQLLSNRNAGDAGSQFVDLKRGELHRADFAVADGNGSCTQPLLDQINSRRKKIEHDNINLEQSIRSTLTTDPLNYSVSDVRGQPASGCISAKGVVANCDVALDKSQPAVHPIQISPIAAPKLVDLEQVLEQANDNTLHILNLKDGQILPIDQTTVQIKGMANTQIQLWANGEQVPEKRIGKKAILADRQIAGFDFIGVALKAGNNELEVRQLDMMGNVRAKQTLHLIVPDQLHTLNFNSPKQDIAANGHDIYQAVIRLVDQHGTPVASRTPLTLNSTIGTIQLKDLDTEKPGIQVFVEGGSLVVPIQSPSQPGEGVLEVESGVFHASQPLRFLPDLRPMIASGMIDGVINFKRFDPKNLSQVDSRDGFEEELNQIAQSNNGQTTASGRAALFLKGKVKGEYLLTLAYDSDKDKHQRLFRDIRPDEYYPVYGDAAAKGFDAQSTSKFYIRVDKGRSYAMYGDYVTRTDSDEGLSIGQYNRSLTGFKSAYENERSKVTAFAARTNSTQITDEQRGLGITGPYPIRNVSNDSILRNSEKVEIIIRDRNNPGLIISRQTLNRFSDYEVDTFSNSIFLKTAVASVDSNLNPIYLRITTESDQGGPEYTVAGVSGVIKINPSLSVGGSYVKSNDPLTHEQLASANAVWKIGTQGKVVAEIARSENTINPDNTLFPINASASATGDQSGFAGRIELDYKVKNADIHAYHNQADSGFYNTSSPITAGRTESGLKVQSRINTIGLLKAEAIRTEDQANNGVREGITASVERAINKLISLELGLRTYRESQQAATLSSINVTPYSGTTVRAKLTTQLPRAGSNAFFEIEQDVQHSDRQNIAVGGNYQLNDKTRLYARQELLSSIGGLYDLNDSQRRNTTVFGIDSRYQKNGTAFSEYRVRDGISAREAEAAMGLRNRWQVKDGVFIDGSFEKVQVLEGINNQAQNTTAASVGVEYLANTNWKAVARLEQRWAEQSDTLLSTLGFAYKVNDDVTVLTKNVFSQTDNTGTTSGDRTLDRFQLGLAYRDLAQNRFDALSKIEYRYENDETNLTSPLMREAYIFSTVANYHPTRRLTLSGQYAIKKLNVNFDHLASSGIVQMASGRAMYDINKRWDAGLNAGVLWSNASAGQRLMLGAEIGYLMAANLWISGGYNFSGYTDKDLTDGDTTAQGPYLRLRFKFDEDLFSGHKPAANPTLEPPHVQ